MLQRVVLQLPEPVTFDIDSVNPDDIIIVKSISGLDAIDATLFTGDFARNGGYYQGRRYGSRNPVFNLKLNPDYKNDIEVSDIREMLYDWFQEPFPDSDELKVVLVDDRKPDRYFIGVTEKLPAEIFTKEPTAQISMICVDPFLKSVDAVSVSNPGGWVSVPVDYEGSVRTGFEMTFKVNAATSQMVVDVNGKKMTLVKPTGQFQVNEVIKIRTLTGSRVVQHQGQDVMAYLAPAAVWVELNKGANVIKTYGSVEADGKVVLTNYNYRAAWRGI